MKKLQLIIGVLIIFFRVSAQNTMVFNPSFEYGVIPDNLDQIDRCDSVGYGGFCTDVPEYFHELSPNPQVSVPNNAFGYQRGFAGRNHYLGFVASSEIGARCSLVINSAATVPGQQYILSIGLSRANYSMYSTDTITIGVGGVRLYSVGNSDTSQMWIQRTWIFTATQPYANIFIFGGEEMTLQNGAGQSWAYYYVGGVYMGNWPASVGIPEPITEDDDYTLINESDVLGIPINSDQKGLHIQTYLNAKTGGYYHRKIYR